jgi:uncharacterized membrane protein
MSLFSGSQGFLDFTLPIIDKIPMIRAIIATLLVFILPGFTWTLIFFKKLNLLEKVALSFGLSIALVTLSILFANIVLHIKITGLNSLLTIIVITVAPLGFYYLKKPFTRKHQANR